MVDVTTAPRTISPIVETLLINATRAPRALLDAHFVETNMHCKYSQLGDTVTSKGIVISSYRPMTQLGMQANARFASDVIEKGARHG